MTTCFFVSDLHGSPRRYRRLFEAIAQEEPAAVFVGGDLLPGFGVSVGEQELPDDFLRDFVFVELRKLHVRQGEDYPQLFVILGNDDPRVHETALIEAEDEGLVTYLHMRRGTLLGRSVYGYANVPPSPFRLKDFERYDVSRYVDPGCVSPEDGARSVEADPSDVRYGTIARDLEQLVGDADVRGSVFLFHTPPHKTALDRAALDGKMVDHVPLDLHIGSIAVRRFIEERKPAVSLHGHVHESARITGKYLDRIGDTVMLSAAHDGPELALVRFDLERPDEATRELL